MESKEYYEALLRVYDYLSENRDGIDCATATNLADEYWPRIAHVFKDAGAGLIEYGGDFYPTQGHLLNPLAADARNALAQYERMDQDRELENNTKIESVTYARKAYLLSEKTARWQRRGLIFTGIVALGQLTQWIIMIVRWISNP